MTEEKTLLRAVVVFPVRRSKVLLAKKTSKIGAGCWNGYGGGIEEDELPSEAAVRELHEESGLIAKAENFKKVAEISFHNQKEDRTMFTCRCNVFIVRSWTARVRETEEMRTPTWFQITKPPLENMMPADRVWVPLIFSGWKIVGEAWYGPHQKMLLRPMKIRYVNILDV